MVGLNVPQDHGPRFCIGISKHLWSGNVRNVVNVKKERKMIKIYRSRCWGLIGVLLLCGALISFCGCDDDPDCDKRRFPQPYTGYYLFSQTYDDDAITIIYTNGKGHYVVWYSEDECERFVESEFWIESEIPE